MYKKLGRYKQEAKVNFDKKSIRIIGTFYGKWTVGKGKDMDVHVRAGGRITPPLLSACSYLVGHAIDYSGKARKRNLESFSLKCHGQGIL